MLTASSTRVRSSHSGPPASSVHTAMPLSLTPRLLCATSVRVCCCRYACAEHQELIWLWRGAPEQRDDAMLPTHPTPEATHTVETILDYGCDWSYIVENNLDTPHLYWLHDGSIPPIESLAEAHTQCPPPSGHSALNATLTAVHCVCAAGH